MTCNTVVAGGAAAWMLTGQLIGTSTLLDTPDQGWSTPYQTSLLISLMTTSPSIAGTWSRPR